MVVKEYVTWKQVENFICAAVDLYEEENISGVYGLPRGGLIFAVMLSHRLNVPMLAAPVDGCLIVDDICDSGESLLHYVENSSGIVKNKYRIATMYYKKNDFGIVPDFYQFKKDNKWVVFPWEERSEE